MIEITVIPKSFGKLPREYTSYKLFKFNLMVDCEFSRKGGHKAASHVTIYNFSGFHFKRNGQLIYDLVKYGRCIILY